MGMFLVTPDIFESLDDSAVTGTRANALAMLGEIVASQTGSARVTDVELLRALGHENGEGERIPFARVFPVGRYVGAQRTIFGDGTPNAVYRGLGRGLAGMVLSGTATQQFIEWDLTNQTGDQGSLEFLGWGNKQWNNIPWGTFGYASLSMGRDRYAEYSAQRLARSSVDKLLHGHLQPGNDASDEEQVNAILHHADFQQLESAWRGLHYLVNNTETDEMLKIRVLNIAKPDLAKTLKRYKGTAWDQSPLFKKVYEEEYGQFGGEPFGCIVGDYYFDQSPQDVEMLTEMSKRNDFGWDFIGGSDLWRHYKPAREVYCGFAELMEVEPPQVLMVATHQSDLDAARGFGLRTAFIERPQEWGSVVKDDSGSPDNDFHAKDLNDLAAQLNC